MNAIREESGMLAGTVVEGLRTSERRAQAAELSLRNAPALCRAIEAELAEGTPRIALDLSDLGRADAVGLATLVKAAERAARAEARFAIRPSAGLREALLRAQLFEELPLVAAVDAADTVVPLPGIPGSDTGAAFVTHTHRLGLRLPAPDDVDLFVRWAQDPLLDQMVGSELLYQCRHRGADRGAVRALLRHDPTALTFLVEPLEPPFRTLGFVRMYGINLAQQYGFIEIAMTTVESVRHGWGVEAARLLVAWAHDVLGLRRVEAKVYEYNVLSVNALRRNGFQREGVLREARIYNGQRWNILVYSLLAEEMAAQRERERFPYLGFWSQPR
jgi:RimJ/RimL family protein N-acetyltransferase/ABC-type transporter Mla MlaB component